MPGPSFIRLAARGGRILIELRGEVDIQTVPPLQRALASALSVAPDSLTIDLAEVNYLSLSAIGAILAAHDGSVRTDTEMVVIAPPRTLRRLMGDARHDRMSISSS